MAGIIRALIALMLLAFIAKTIERRRHSPPQADGPQWPSWDQGKDSAESTASPSGETSSEAASASATESWADPVDGDCPDGFPVKVKLSSGIYHAEGMINWERLHADRCYVSEAAAEADGFRASKM